MINKRNLTLLLCGSFLVLAAACGDDAVTEEPADNPGDTANNDNGGKEDTPDGADTPENQCLDRQQDVLNSSQKAFVESAIRWSCSDVAGVNTIGRDDRGQEYCEYQAIVTPPPLSGEPGDERPDAVALGQLQDGGGVTDLKLDLNDDQIFYLEDHPDEVVGQCVFSTWHADIDHLLPVCKGDPTCTQTCAGEPDCEEPSIMGFPLTAENFRMKVGFNSNSAASALVNDCVDKVGVLGDPDDPADPLHNDFFRGCMTTAALYGTQWRRSDPAVCAAAIRLRECGCSLPDNANLGRSLVPPQPQFDDQGNEVITLWGFPLGTWSGATELPLGCSYVNTGTGGQNIVSCDLTASDLLVSLDDPKGKCREKYGDNVVVHVPVPGELITCQPPVDGPYADTCNDTPWVVDN